MGIFMATIARTMPQFGLLVVLVLLPMEVLSGGSTPRESMPEFAQNIMLAAPTTHFVSLSQAILFRGAGLEVVWPEMLTLVVIGSVLFILSLRRFRKSLSSLA
jgi:ABC-2 type transport system permease protein